MHPCGTPSCAFGHYAVRSDLQCEFTAQASPLPWEGVLLARSGEKVHYNDEEVLQHFEITEPDSERLFSSEWNAAELVEEEERDPRAFLALSVKTANEAADWIERFVAERD
jgi:hypothetical protein